jgi:cystathionine gamma-lyase
MRFDTRLVHAGQDPEPGTGDLVPPVHLTATYERRVQDPLRYFYGRGENPTWEALESSLAALEDARYAAVFSSGQAASATALNLLPPGRRLVAGDDLYGGTYALFETLERQGSPVEYVDFTDAGAVAAALGRGAGLVWLETPSNPMLKVADVAAIRGLADRQGARLVVDNTFAGPALQQPLRLGADVSVYSTTKGISGHSDVLGGALVYNDQQLDRDFRSYRSVMGNVPGAFDCFLVHRGLKTLSLRAGRQVVNAQRIAAVLAESARVGLVRYPGLAAHPQHDLAVAQMSGPGAILSFEYLGDPVKLMDRLRLFACAVSLGGVRSLIEHPATMTHAPLPPATRRRLGLSDQLLRISAGIEDPADLEADLLAAL